MLRISNKYRDKYLQIIKRLTLTLTFEIDIERHYLITPVEPSLDGINSKTALGAKLGSMRCET